MRWLAGFLLVFAAVLKALQLLSEPTAIMISPLGRFLLPAQIGVELAVGIVVLSGVYWRTLQRFVVLLFTGFAGYSLYLALNGADSCGCFGSVHIHPWWTFCMDVSIVFGVLIAARHHQRPETLGAMLREHTDAPCLSVVRRKFIVAVTSAAILTTLLLIRYTGHRTATAKGISGPTGGLVILEPEQWVGQELPIAEFIDTNLSSGEWIAVLHRHDCAACHEALPHYEQLAAAGQQIALIEVPPYGDSLTTASACRRCRLKDDREWFVQTPVEIRLRDGIVLAAKGHDD